MRITYRVRSVTSILGQNAIMKTLTMLFSLLIVTSVYGSEIMGIEDGVYEGGGKLVSQTMLVPNFTFTSRRELKNGVVSVTSKAKLMGHTLLTLSGKLKFISRSETHLDIYNLNEIIDGKPKKAGSAVCDPRSCTFTATINDGKFTLTETWVRDGDGFQVVNGSQNFVGIKGIYQAEFVPAH